MNILNILTNFMTQSRSSRPGVEAFGVKPETTGSNDITIILIAGLILAAVIAVVAVLYKLVWPFMARQKQHKAMFDSLIAANKLTAEETRVLIDVAKRFNLTNLSLVMVSRSLIERYFEEKTADTAGPEKESLTRQLQNIRVKLFS